MSRVMTQNVRRAGGERLAPRGLLSRRLFDAFE